MDIEFEFDLMNTMLLNFILWNSLIMIKPRPIDFISCIILARHTSTNLVSLVGDRFYSCRAVVPLEL